MNKLVCPNVFFLICIFLLVTNCFIVEVIEARSCKSCGQIQGKKPPPGECNMEDSSACCVEGKLYDIYFCSPKVSSCTKANLTLKIFDRGGDGSPPSECDQQYHSDNEPVVALSTGWFDKGKRCLHFINIYGNGKRVKAKVVDQCDSRVGCSDANNYAPPCGNNIVQATGAVWNALGEPRSQWVAMEIHWSHA